MYKVSELELSFSAIIDQVREENTRLYKQIEEVTRKADAEYERRAIAEEKVHQLYRKQISLEIQLREQADLSKLLQGIVANYAANLDRVVPVLEGLRK